MGFEYERDFATLDFRKHPESGAPGRPELPRQPDAVKARCAEIFRERYLQVRNEPRYQAALARHRDLSTDPRGTGRG